MIKKTNGCAEIYHEHQHENFGADKQNHGSGNEVVINPKQFSSLIGVL
jgi:hypothetical protein